MPTAIQIIGAALFAVAILHTFATTYFEHLAHTQPAHAGLWHLLGEVEVVFGFWALILVIAMFAIDGSAASTHYIDTRNFTEPMFVFAIMVIAGTRPILQTATAFVDLLARLIPLSGSLGFYFIVLTLVPLLGSFITEPAAMTLAAMILAERLFARGVSLRLKYATLGVLFVNISIGGTLTFIQDILASRAAFYSNAELQLDTSAAPLGPTFEALRRQVRTALGLPI